MENMLGQVHPYTSDGFLPLSEDSLVGESQLNVDSGRVYNKGFV